MSNIKLNDVLAIVKKETNNEELINTLTQMIENDKQKKSFYSKKWYNNNKDHASDVRRIYYEKNKQEISNKRKEYYKNNKEKYEQRYLLKKSAEKDKGEQLNMSQINEVLTQIL